MDGREEIALEMNSNPYEVEVELTTDEAQWLYEQKQRLNGMPTGIHRKHT